MDSGLGPAPGSAVYAWQADSFPNLRNQLAQAQSARRFSASCSLRQQNSTRHGRIQKHLSKSDSPNTPERRKSLRLTNSNGDRVTSLSNKKATTRRSSALSNAERPMTWHYYSEPGQSDMLFNSGWGNGWAPRSPEAARNLPETNSYNDDLTTSSPSYEELWGSCLSPYELSSGSLAPLMGSRCYSQNEELDYQQNPPFSTNPELFPPPASQALNFQDIQDGLEGMSFETYLQASSNPMSMSQQSSQPQSRQRRTPRCESRDGDELVGMGLYDSHEPISKRLSNCDSFLSSSPPSETGKGLKLEETWSPPETDELSELDMGATMYPASSQEEDWSSFSALPAADGSMVFTDFQNVPTEVLYRGMFSEEDFDFDPDLFTTPEKSWFSCDSQIGRQNAFNDAKYWPVC